MKRAFANEQRIKDEERLQEDEFLMFWRDFFVSEEDIRQFAVRCFKRKETRWAFNRIEWYVKLADAQKEDNVKILFLIAMGEMIMRVKDGRFEDENAVPRSTQDMKDFFNAFDDVFKEQLKNTLYREFRTKFTVSRRQIPFENFAEIFANIRHRVAHGKNTYDFSFKERENTLYLFRGIVGKPGKKRSLYIHVEMSYEVFRNMMTRTAIKILHTLIR